MFCSHGVFNFLHEGVNFSISGFLGKARIEATESQIAYTLPCQSTMRELFKKTVAETLCLVHHDSLGAKFHFACDAENKRITHHMS